MPVTPPPPPSMGRVAMLHFTSGDMFAKDVQIRVNTVNCVGVMGAGVALAFKTRYPAMFRDYKKACSAGSVQPGKLSIWRTLTEWIINFPTKRHWRETQSTRTLRRASWHFASISTAWVSR